MTVPPTQVYPRAGRTQVPEDLPDLRQHTKALARGVNTALQGHLSNTLQVTLTANVTMTTITDSRLSIQSAVVMVPLTADAAVEVAAGGLYVVPAAGIAVIHHANSAQTDRTFITSLVG